ncbi:MAG: nitrile hydratase accessory protein [Albidovulum sp.]
MTAEIPSHFDAPWHAQLFALTVAMSDQGHFTWASWTRAFGATLKRHGAARPLDGSADYYAAWLETLEALLDQTGLATAPEAKTMRSAWEKAYHATPHGKPVRLASPNH